MFSRGWVAGVLGALFLTGCANVNHAIGPDQLAADTTVTPAAVPFTPPPVPADSTGSDSTGPGDTGRAGTDADDGTAAQDATAPGSRLPFGSLPPVRKDKGKVIYLTFDDGPWPDSTEQILNLLQTHRAHATFFLVGREVPSHPDLVARMTAEGHRIGNHTWDHPAMRDLDEAARAEQWESTRDAVIAAGGRMGHCWRPPYASKDASVVRQARSLGYRTVMWDVDPTDWKEPTAESLVKQMQAATKPGLTVLLHDGGGNRQHTVEAVEFMLGHWAAQGYRFAALPQCA